MDDARLVPDSRVRHLCRRLLDSLVKTFLPPHSSHRYDAHRGRAGNRGLSTLVVARQHLVTPRALAGAAQLIQHYLQYTQLSGPIGKAGIIQLILAILGVPWRARERLYAARSASVRL